MMWYTERVYFEHISRARLLPNRSVRSLRHLSTPDRAYFLLHKLTSNKCKQTSHTPNLDIKRHPRADNLIELNLKKKFLSARRRLGIETCSGAI